MKQIIIVDYGSQYTHLIKARLREEGHEALVVGPDATANAFKNARGLILSGGPKSVYEEGAPQLSGELARLIFKENIPTLAICYGMQLIAQYAARNYYPAVGSKKSKGQEVGEYGKTTIEISHNIGVLAGLGRREVVWMSHGDSIIRLPPNSHRLDPIVDGEHPENHPPMTINIIGKPIWCLQFHPEVSHTVSGKKILQNFLNICDAPQNWGPKQEFARIQRSTKKRIGNKHVFAFISGGNDSSVLALFLQTIVPRERLHFFYVRGLGPDEDLEKIKLISDDFHIVDARRSIYRALEGVVDPEEKRQKIGKMFVRVWSREAKKLAASLGCDIEDLLLAQGTIYPDVIESGGSRHADRIKSHHNEVVKKLLGVGGIVESFTNLFKPDVREIGKMLGVNERLITQHPSPGPGYAVRFLCYNGGREAPLQFDFVRSEPREEKFLEAMKSERALQKETEQLGYKSWVLPLKSKGVLGDQNIYSYTAGLIGPHEKKSLLELANAIPNRFKGKINRVVWLVAPKSATSLGLTSMKRDYFRPKTKNMTARADEILVRNLRLSNLYHDISQALCVLATLSFNRLGYCAIIRAIETKDYMTASPYWLPEGLIHKIADEIMTEIPEVQMVFYDLTTKPPGTIEWE